MSCIPSDRTRTVKLNYLNGTSAYITFQASVVGDELYLDVPGKEGCYRMFKHDGHYDFHLAVREYDQIP